MPAVAVCRQRRPEHCPDLGDVICQQNYDPKERTHALGPIFRTVFWYSIAGAAIIGTIAMLQAYVFPGVIPIPPVK